MKTLQFIAGLVIVLVGAAIIAPLLNPFIPYEFDRILSRTVLVLFIGLVIFLIAKNRGVDWKYYGLSWDDSSAMRLTQAFLIGFLTLAAMIFVEILAGVRSWHFIFNQTIWPLKILKYVVSAFFIGLLEEFVFRGVLFRTIEKRFRLIPALILTNIIYSSVHFLRYNEDKIFDAPNFFTCFEIYLSVLKPLLNFGEIWPGAIGLFLFGIALSYAYLRTGRNLVFSIGLHAGAVMFLKLDGWFIAINSETHKIWFGGSDLHGSILGWVFIILMIAVVHLTTCKKGERG